VISSSEFSGKLFGVNVAVVGDKFMGGGAEISHFSKLRTGELDNSELATRFRHFWGRLKAISAPNFSDRDNNYRMGQRAGITPKNGRFLGAPSRNSRVKSHDIPQKPVHPLMSRHSAP
jgi:hypothetical protein